MSAKSFSVLSMPTLILMSLALIAGVAVASVDTSLSLVAIAAVPLALLGLLAVQRYPFGIGFLMLFWWCTAPAFEWIQLGSIAGFSLRPDYLTILIITGLLSNGLRSRQKPSNGRLSGVIIALVLSESLTIFVDAGFTGDIRLLLLLLIKTLGAGVTYFFLRSHLKPSQVSRMLAFFIAIAILPVAVSSLVGITRSSELFDLLLSGAGTQGQFNTPFGIIPRAFLLGAEPYLIAVLGLCLAITLGTGVVFRFRVLAAVMVMLLFFRLPFTLARNLILTYLAVLLLAIVASQRISWMKLSIRTRLALTALVIASVLVGIVLVQSSPQLQQVLNFSLQRFGSAEEGLDVSSAAGRYIGASIGLDMLLNDPIALIAGYGSRVQFIGASLIPAGDIATPISIWFTFGLLGLAAVTYASLKVARHCWHALATEGVQRILAMGILFTLVGWWFQTLIAGSPFITTPYETILVLGILLVFLESAEQVSPSQGQKLPRHNGADLESPVLKR